APRGKWRPFASCLVPLARSRPSPSPSLNPPLPLRPLPLIPERPLCVRCILGGAFCPLLSAPLPSRTTASTPLTFPLDARAAQKAEGNGNERTEISQARPAGREHGQALALGTGVSKRAGANGILSNSVLRAG